MFTDCALVGRLSGAPKAFQPKKASVHWHETGKSEPNEHELLFFAFLLLKAATRVSDTYAWAKKVVKHADRAKAERSQWKPLKEEWPSHNKVSTLWRSLEDAYHNVRDNDSLAVIAATMRIWDGAGRHDHLEAEHLRQHFKRDLHGVRRTSRDGKMPTRGCTWSVVYVAEMIHCHGPALRRALKQRGRERVRAPA